MLLTRKKDGRGDQTFQTKRDGSIDRWEKGEERKMNLAILEGTRGRPDGARWAQTADPGGWLSSGWRDPKRVRVAVGVDSVAACSQQS